MCIPRKLDSCQLPFVLEFKKLYQSRFIELGICWDQYRLSIFQDRLDADPMESRYSMKIIFYYPSIASKFELSLHEQFALLAHEIGHLRDQTGVENGDVKPSFEREYNADDLVLELGLGEHLLSALRKFEKVEPEDRISRIDAYISNIAR